MCKIRKLKQTGSCAAFTAQFIEILAELDWTNQTKIQEYYDRLKDSVKTMLCNCKGRYFTRDFEEYAKVCVNIDNEVHNLALNTARNTTAPSANNYRCPFVPYANPSLTSAAPNPPPASNSVVPMEIDAMHRGPLTNEEKERRRTNKLCLYCSQANHFASACPNKKTK
ncbi:hypothetical protein FA15DRAFT_617027, partial [Coprinopsis marcescibilis]